LKAENCVIVERANSEALSVPTEKILLSSASDSGYTVIKYLMILHELKFPIFIVFLFQGRAAILELVYCTKSII
jgi:hypothetical protein